MTSHGARCSPVWMAATLLLLCVLGIALGSAVGSTGLESWLKAWHDDVAWQIVWDIRLPRSVGACAAGALLGLAGAIAQGLFRNPLADPYLLGSASGASLGVAVALALLGGNPFATEWWVRLGLTGAAFVGLAAPHLVRSVVNAKHQWLVVLSALMGGVLLLAADLLARMALAPQEMPVGVLTSVLGGGYLLWLMYRSQTVGAKP